MRGGRAAASCSPPPRRSTAFPRTASPPRDTPTAPDQPLRHLQAHVRVDAARSWPRPQPTCAMSACAISTSPAPIRGGRIGQATAKATLLIKVACEAIVGKRVARVDLRHRLRHARRHRRARLHPRRGSGRARTWMRSTTCARGGASTTLNVRLRPRLQRAPGARERPARGRQAAHGARGAAPRRATRRPWSHAPIASARELGWQPRLDDLDTIVRTSLRWEEQPAARALVSG